MRFIRPFTQLATVLAVLGAFIPGRIQAQQTTVSFDSGSQFLYSSATKTPANLLTAGNLATTGDGAVLQLGYYSTATVGNYFSGTFIPITGMLSANTAYNYTSIGDLNSNGAGAGQFALILSFTPGNATTGNNLPATGTPLAIRFFNNTTLANSTLFNAVSDSVWTWQTPGVPGPTVTVSLDQTGLQWLGGASSAFYTSQTFSVVPEPSSFLLGGIGCVGLFWAVKRRRTLAQA